MLDERKLMGIGGETHSEVAGFLASIEKKLSDEDIHESIKRLADENALPKVVVNSLDAFIVSLEKIDVNGLGLQMVAERLVSESIAKYQDNRFDIPNFEFLKTALVEFVQETKTERELKGIDVLFFDADGLKAVNDLALNGHAAGDRYLEKISAVFAGGETVRLLESHGVRVVAARKSGDEFMMAIKNGSGDEFWSKDGDGNASEKISLPAFVIESIKQEISDLDMSDVQDFSLEEQKMRYAHIGPDEWPENFSFQASISGGSANLVETLLVSKDKVLDNSDGEFPSVSALKLIGCTIDSSDKNMIIAKQQDKASRALSLDPNVRMNERIYRSVRTEGSEQIIKLEEVNRKLTQRVEKLKKELSMCLNEQQD